MMADSLTQQGAATIRLARTADVPAMVLVHQAGFPGFFLSFLGPRFLRELYTALLEDPDGIGFVASGPADISGFVVGTAQPAGFYRRLLQQSWWRFAIASVPPVLKRPSIVPRLLRALSMPEQATQHVGRGVLMSIVVLPQLQGDGIGQTLVRAFLEEASHRRLYQVELTTDKNNNAPANRFYQQLGFTCERTYETPEGRVMNVYVIDIPALPGSDSFDT